MEEAPDGWQENIPETLGASSSQVQKPI